MTGCKPTELSDLAGALRARRYVAADEAALQEAVPAALRAAGYHVEEQVPLDRRNRIDAVVTLAGGARVGIELKTRGGRTALILQLRRYAGTGKVDTLVVATTSVRLCFALPASLMGVPIAVVRLPGGVI